MALLTACALVAGIAPAAAHADPEAAGRAAFEPQLRGLRVASSGECAGGYRIVGTDFCTHGPDTRPAGRRLRVQPPSIRAVVEGPLPEAVLCDGDGTSGKRVQAIYARLAGTPSRRSTVVPQVRNAAASVQSAFLASAARTDGVRRPRWVTDGDCRLKVVEVALSEAARTNLGATITELRALGHGRADRKYLVWWDTQVYCGIATFWGDDRPGADNLSNTQPGYARVDSGCWGWAEAHELMHLLGAVQNSAPHSTHGVAPGAFAHCTDDWDAMCYPDAPGVTMTVVCPDRGLDGQFDCGNDDYFHTDPPSGSYLGSHWNTADSGWLARSVVQLTAPVPRLAAGGVVGLQRVPVTATLAGRAPLAGLETLQAQRRVGDAAWRPAGPAEATPGGDTTATSVSARLPLATRSRFRVRVVGAGDAAGPWVVGPTVTLRLRGDASPALRHRGSWRTVTRAGALGGTARQARTAGPTVRFRANAREVGIIAGRSPLAGRIRILVDGVAVRTVDLRSNAAQARRIVAAIRLDPGPHTVMVRVLAPVAPTPGWRVELDGVLLVERD